jgi:6-pyruvoyl-tetrahydropterin synthase
MSKEIFVKTQFEAKHRWPKAPEEVKFLRNLHRHIFHVEMGFEVTHNDRELEFFMVKKRIDKSIQQFLCSVDTSFSCEQCAEYLVKDFKEQNYPVLYAIVSEDNENGAKVYAV